MAARAPGDAAHAICRTCNTFPVNRAFTHIQPKAGGGVPGYAGSERGAASERAAYSVQISQRRAAGMRCAAGQLTELRADCAADGHGGPGPPPPRALIGPPPTAPPPRPTLEPPREGRPHRLPPHPPRAALR